MHFAQINRRDGFFIVSREKGPAFEWSKLEGRTLLADHGLQPLVMLKYALKHNHVDWDQVKIVDAGAPDRMESAFRDGEGDYLHQQAPVTAGEVVASVGASMPPVAFSSLCCAREFQKDERYETFVAIFDRARAWVRSAGAGEVAEAEAEFFPGVSREALTEAIRRYQALGCWDSGVEIPRELYEQVLNVFESAGAIATRHAYEEVVVA